MSGRHELGDTGAHFVRDLPGHALSVEDHGLNFTRCRRLEFASGAT
jgi:hypothetical protein